MSTVETIEVTRQEPARLFDAAFWLECEQEADRMLRTITGVDDPVGRLHSGSRPPTRPTGSADLDIGAR